MTRNLNVKCMIVLFFTVKKIEWYKFSRHFISCVSLLLTLNSCRSALCTLIFNSRKYAASINSQQYHVQRGFLFLRKLLHYTCPLTVLLQESLSLMSNVKQLETMPLALREAKLLWQNGSNKKFNLAKRPTQARISKILKQKATPYDSVARNRPAKNPELELALEMWLSRQEESHIPVSWQLFMMQAKFFANAFNISDFKASNGWQDHFRRRSGFHMHRYHGQAGSTDSQLIEEGRSRLKEKIAEYAPQDVYNMDETALMYSSSPTTTLTRNSAAGVKGDKTRITVALWVNSDGSDKRELLFIGTHEKLRCFKGQTGTVT